MSKRQSGLVDHDWTDSTRSMTRTYMVVSICVLAIIAFAVGALIGWGLS